MRPLLFKSLVLASLAVSTLAAAKDVALPLPESAIPGLKDKTFIVTRHEKPSFVAMTAGKAAFAMFGAGAMIAEGNQMVKDNGIADPADVVDKNLSAVLVSEYGMQQKPSPETPIKPNKPADILKLELDADYILDIRSGGWNFAYYPTDWNTYWAGYSVQVQLLDSKTKTLVSNLACTASSNKHANSPSKEAMLADGAKLLKDMTTGFGWTCFQLLAKEQFHLDAAAVAATPAEYVDPLSSYAKATPAATANAETKVAEPTN
jgi:hypothetical protein